MELIDTNKGADGVNPNSTNLQLKSPLNFDNAQKFDTCNQCRFSSKYAENLKFHMRTHSGERQYKCNKCDYAATNASYLRRHSHIHTGGKSNKCSQCNFASSQHSRKKVGT